MRSVVRFSILCGCAIGMPCLFPVVFPSQLPLVVRGQTPDAPSPPKESVEQKIAYLRNELKSDDSVTRRVVVEMLIEFGEPAKAAIPDMVAMMMIQGEMDWETTKQSLLEFDSRLTERECEKRLATQKGDSRLRLYKTLFDRPREKSADAEEASRILCRGLQDPESSVRARIAIAQWVAAASEGRVRASHLQPVLVEMIADDRSEAERTEALRALGGLGTDAAAAIPAVDRILRNRNNNLTLRQSAASSLGKIGADNPNVAEILKKEFVDKRNITRLRIIAADALIRSRFAPSAAAELQNALRESLERTRVALTAEHFEERELIDVLIRGTPRFRPGKRAVPFLKEAFQSVMDLPEPERGEFFIALCDAVATVGPDAEELFPTLVAALQSMALRDGQSDAFSRAFVRVLGRDLAIRRLSSIIDATSDGQTRDNLDVIVAGLKKQ